MVANQEHAKFDAGKGNTVARIKKGSHSVEIIVNMEDAVKVKKTAYHLFDFYWVRKE